MSYHTCKEYKVYQRYRNTIPLEDGSELDLYDYCVIFWDKHLQIYAEYSFEMAELLKVLCNAYDYDLPQSVIDALERDGITENEAQLSKERQPSVYGKSEAST